MPLEDTDKVLQPWFNSDERKALKAATSLAVDEAVASDPTTLDDLSDVDATAPDVGDTIVWDGAAWAAGQLVTVSSHLTSPSQGIPSGEWVVTGGTQFHQRIGNVVDVNIVATVQSTDASSDPLYFEMPYPSNDDYLIETVCHVQRASDSSWSIQLGGVGNDQFGMTMPASGGPAEGFFVYVNAKYIAA